MADYRSEDPDGGFKKTFATIAVVHLVLLGGLLLAALFQSKKNSDTVVWMNPGSFGGDSASAESQPTSGSESAIGVERRITAGQPPGYETRNESGRNESGRGSSAADATARSLDATAGRPTNLSCQFRSRLRLRREPQLRRRDQRSSKLLSRRPDCSKPTPKATETFAKAESESDSQTVTRTFGHAKSLPKKRE